MILLRCHIRGFGALEEIHLDFGPGLNVVHAANEGGKSTLQRFIAAMLYGQLRPELKQQRRLDPWVEGYQPWRARNYGGALWFRLEDGRELEIRRTFGREAGTVEIYSASGQEVSGDYDRQRNGELLFATQHLGLPKELFESVAVVRENRAAEIQGHDSIRDRIANLVEFGDEELSVRNSLLTLEQALESIGSERAPTRPYRQALDARERLVREKSELEERKRAHALWLQEREQRESEVARLENDLRAAAAASRNARYCEAEQQLFNMEQLESEICRLDRAIADCGGDPGFPAHLLEELSESLGARAGAAGRLAELRSRFAGAASQLEAAGAKHRTLERFERFAAGTEGELVVDLYHQHLSLTVQRDSAQRTLTRLVAEQEELAQRLANLPAPLADPAVDWPQKVLEAGESERRGALRAREISERMLGVREALALVHRQSSSRRALAVGAGVAAVLFVLSIPVMPVDGWARFGPLVPAVAGAVASVVWWTRAEALAVESAGYGAEIRTFEEELSRVQADSEEPRREVDRAMGEAGCSTQEEFLDAARRTSGARERLGEIGRRIAEAESNRGNAATVCSRVFAQLRDLLANAGLSCSPGNLPSQMDLFRNSLRSFRESDRDFQGCSQTVESLASEQNALQGELAKLDRRIGAILAEGNVDTADAFREACRKRQTYLDLSERRLSRARELERLRGMDNVETLREKVALLKSEAAGAATPDAPNEKSDLLPYLPSLAEAEAEEQRVSALVAAAREELARVGERVAQAFNHYRTLPEIEEDLGAAEEEVQRLELNRAALETALETVQALAREQQEVLAPQLNSLVERRFLRLCAGRYEEVKIDADFEIRVRECGSGELRNTRSLSRGTQDQIYFALRFGILELLSRADEPCPCLLDEPFAAYDRERSEEAFRILSGEAAKRQLLLFTCREDTRDLALSHDGLLIHLNRT